MRGNLAAVRKAGLDPDIPPPFFDRLAMVESLWGFGEAEAAEYARALAAGDGAALARLLRRSRRFAREARAGFAGLAGVLLSGAAPVAALPPAQGRKPGGGWLDAPVGGTHG